MLDLNLGKIARRLHPQIHIKISLAKMVAVGQGKKLSTEEETLFYKEVFEETKILFLENMNSIIEERENGFDKLYGRSNDQSC